MAANGSLWRPVAEKWCFHILPFPFMGLAGWRMAACLALMGGWLHGWMDGVEHHSCSIAHYMSGKFTVGILTYNTIVETHTSYQKARIVGFQHLVMFAPT